MFTLTIETGNAAFGDDDIDVKRNEIARILQSVSYQLATMGCEEGKIRDINGNHVGEYILTQAWRQARFAPDPLSWSLDLANRAYGLPWSIVRPGLDHGNVIVDHEIVIERDITGT